MSIDLNPSMDAGVGMQKITRTTPGQIHSRISCTQRIRKSVLPANMCSTFRAHVFLGENHPQPESYLFFNIQRSQKRMQGLQTISLSDA